MEGASVGLPEGANHSESVLVQHPDVDRFELYGAGTTTRPHALLQYAMWQLIVRLVSGAATGYFERVQSRVHGNIQRLQQTF